MYCEGKNKVKYLCCEESCKKNPFNCLQEECLKCSNNHQYCLMSVPIENINELKEKQKRATEDKYRIQKKYEGIMKNLTEKGKTLHDRMLGRNHYEWGLTQDENNHLSQHKLKMTGQSTAQFLQNFRVSTRIDEKYIFPPVINNELNKTFQILEQLDNNERKLNLISRTLGALDYNIRNVLEDQEGSQKQFYTLIIFHKQLKEIKRIRKELEEVYSVLDLEREYFQDVTYQLFLALFQSLQKNEDRIMQVIQICEDLRKDQYFDENRINHLRRKYEIFRGEFYFMQAEQSDEDVKRNSYEESLKYFQGKGHLDIKDTWKMLKIYKHLGKMDQYLDLLLNLEDYSLTEQDTVKVLEHIRDQYRRIKNKQKQNQYNLKLLQLFKKDRQGNNQKIQDLFNAIIQFYQKHRKYAKALMYQKELMGFCEQKSSLDFNYLRKYLDMNKMLLNFKLILNADKNDCEKLAYESYQRCGKYIQYVENKKNVENEKNQLKNEQKIQECTKCLKFLKQYELYFATQFLQLIKEKQLALSQTDKEEIQKQIEEKQKQRQLKQKEERQEKEKQQRQREEREKQQKREGQIEQEEEIPEIKERENEGIEGEMIEEQKIQQMVEHLEIELALFEQCKKSPARLYKQIVQGILMPALDQNPEKLRIMCWVANYHYLNQLENSAPWLQRVLDIYPEPEFFYKLSHVLYLRAVERSQTNEIIKLLNKCLKIQNQHQEAQLLRAKCLLELDYFEEAKKELELLMQIDKFETGQNLALLGQCYQGLYDIEHYNLQDDPSLKADPSFCKKKRQLFQQAIANYERSLIKTPYEPASLMGIARLKNLDKKFQEARTILNNSFHKMSESFKIEFHCLLGNIYEAEASNLIEERNYRDYDLLERAKQQYEKVREMDNNRIQDLQRILNILN